VFFSEAWFSVMLIRHFRQSSCQIWWGISSEWEPSPQFTVSLTQCSCGGRSIDTS
jgi:hypothetical protein